MADTWDLTRPGLDVDGVNCLYCDQIFGSEAAERKHVNKEHPDESSIRCPACKATRFKRPSDLMGHIERGQCPVLKLEALNRRRQRKMEFRRQLNLQGSARHNFTRFIDKRAPGTTPKYPVRDEYSQSPLRSASIDSALTESISTSSQCDSQSTVVDVCSDGTTNSNKALMTAQRAELESEKESSGDDDETGGGAVDWCLNKYSGKYHCPRGRCPKTFKNPDGLLAHLRSPAHSNVRYACPECHKELHCLQGMTAHAEDTRSRCGIWKTDKFAIYMEQLTGGLIDVIFVDGGDRVKYETSQVAEAEYEKALLARSDGYDDFNKQVW